MTKKNYQCLMIQTKDNRKFCTDESNYAQLIEFANTFDAEISVIYLNEGDVMELEQLASAISDPRHNSNPDYKILERKITSKKISNKNMIASREIKEHVRNTFANGQTVDFHELMKKFKDYRLSYNAFAAHLFKLRKEFGKKGHCIQKIGPGQYRVVSQNQLAEAV